MYVTSKFEKFDINKIRNCFYEETGKLEINLRFRIMVFLILLL